MRDVTIDPQGTYQILVRRLASPAAVAEAWEVFKAPADNVVGITMTKGGCLALALENFAEAVAELPRTAAEQRGESA